MAVNFFNKYPYTDFHELNLSWLIKEIGKKAPGHWVTVTIHPEDWDEHNDCTVTGITGMTADRPFIWQWSPAAVAAGAVTRWLVYPTAQMDEAITFSCYGDTPDGDVTFYILISD